MKTEVNKDFSHNESLVPPLPPNQHAISFQSSKMSQMMPLANYFGVNTATTSMTFSSTNEFIRNSPGFSNSASTSGSSFLDSALGINNKDGFASEWSTEEQYRLEEGLVKYANEPNIAKYIKIAAGLRNKTVRDVALRCRWMMGKRRKHEDYNPRRNAIDRKDKFVESASQAHMSTTSEGSNNAFTSLIYQSARQKGNPLYEGGGIMKHMLEQNTQAFDQIVANFSTYKLKDNIRLFCVIRNNLSVMLSNIKDMPGMMSEMPPLPVTINEDLARKLLPIDIPQGTMGSQCWIQPKQEMR